MATQTDDSPIFIVGHARSGTTLLRLMLSAHPNIYISHETWFYFWESLFPKQRSGSDFLQHFFQTFSFRWLHLDPASILADLPANIDRRDVGRALQTVLQKKAASHGRQRFGDKSPPHTNFVRRILADFPNARIIHITRDPRDCVVSISRTPWGSERELANCIAQERMIRRIRPYASQIHTLKYEDLIANPRSSLQTILDFVGESWDDAVLDHANHRADSSDTPPLPWLSSANQPLGQPSSRRQDVTPARIRLIELACRKSLREYGYTKDELDVEPSRLQICKAGVAGMPDAIRYSLAWLRFVGYLREPKHWGPLHGSGDSGGERLLKKMNPAFWQQHRGFEMPVAPSLPGEEVQP